MNRSIIKSAAGLGALALATVGFVATAPTASAAVDPNGPSGYKITLVARACPDDPNVAGYENVFANEARNNLQESLFNLGPDSNYPGSDNNVDPSIESADPQDACTDINDQQFTLGTDTDGGNSETPSIVTGTTWGPFTTTAGPIARLDTSGNQVGTDTLGGAVTIELTNAQAELAKSGSSNLWVQGGTPANPLIGGRSFAALRCSHDYLNGDNVEWVQYKGDEKHAYCYYFAVDKPSESGTIVVKKVVTGDDAPEGKTFDFGGTVSFNDEPYDGWFALKGYSTVSASNDDQTESFARGVGVWAVTEEGAPDDFTLTDIDCTVTGENGSTFEGTTKSEQLNGVSITLAAGDTVTCTFTNTFGDVPTPTCTSNCSTTPPPCTSNCGGGSTPPANPPSTPTVVQSTPAPAVTVEAAAAVGLPAPAAAAPEAATVPEAQAVPEMGTVPEAVPAGDGSSAPNGTPGWVWLLMALGALGAVTAAAKTMGARR